MVYLNLQHSGILVCLMHPQCSKFRLDQTGLMKPIFHKTDSVAEQFTLETLYKHRKAISIHSKSVQNEKADFQAHSILNTGWLPSFLFCQPIIILFTRSCQ